MKKLLFALGLVLISTAATAQNSAIYKAQAAEQKGDITEAINILETAIQNPKTTKLAEIYNMAAEDHLKLFNNELTKAAQSMPFDTVAFTTHLDKAVEYYTESHEANIKPDAKGRVKIDEKIQKTNHWRLNSMVDYYYYAAMFKLAQRDTTAAVDYFNKFQELPKNPIFSQQEADSIYTVKAKTYMSARCNVATLLYYTKKWDDAIVAADAALKDTVGTHDLYVIKMQSYLAKGDSVNYLNTLNEAVNRTEEEGFMGVLLSYYYSKRDVTGAEKMADELIAKAPEKKSSWYMKGCVDLNLKQDYPSARENFSKALAIDSTFVNANVNMGATYINQIYKDKIDGKFKYVGNGKGILPAQKAAYEKELAMVKSYYQNAQRYMERAREYAPEKPELWGESLLMIYENLQMKDKKAEVEEILKNK